MNRLPEAALLLLIALYGLSGVAQSATETQASTQAGVEPAPHAEAEHPPEDEAATGSHPGPDSAPAEQQEAESDEADSKAEELDKRLDALLGEATAADAYGEPVHCLYRRKYRHIDVISEDLLLFSSGNNYWVNTLKRSCTGLRRSMVIHTVIKGISSLCENDMVYANSSFDLRQGLLSSGRPVVVRANCVLGEFKPIDEVYAASLKAMSRG